MGIENIVDGRGFGIALTGMTVVFAGLVLVSAYIMLLPRVFDWAGRPGIRLPPRKQAADDGALGRDVSRGMDPDLLAAIGYVLQAEREYELSLDDQRITLRDDEEQRVWTAIGRMRTLATRK